MVVSSGEMSVVSLCPQLSSIAPNSGSGMRARLKNIEAGIVSTLGVSPMRDIIWPSVSQILLSLTTRSLVQ